MSLESLLPDILMASLAFAIYGTYHAILAYNTVANPMRTTIGQNRASKKAWCMAVTGKLEYAIVAVQTLRNGMMASQLLANTSFAILSALTIFLVSSNTKNANFAAIGLPPVEGIGFLANRTVLPGIKLFTLVLAFIAAFFFYILSMRAFYQVPAVADVE